MCLTPLYQTQRKGKKITRWYRQVLENTCQSSFLIFVNLKIAFALLLYYNCHLIHFNELISSLNMWLSYRLASLQLSIVHIIFWCSNFFKMWLVGVFSRFFICLFRVALDNFEGFLLVLAVTVAKIPCIPFSSISRDWSSWYQAWSLEFGCPMSVSATGEEDCPTTLWEKTTLVMSS